MVDLTVEDGTIVAGANSYNSLDAIKDFFAARLYVPPDDDDLLTGYAIRSMDYLASYGSQYKGARTSSLQTLDWPRTGAIIDSPPIDPDTGFITGPAVPFDPNTIPANLIKAQCQLCVELTNGVELQPTFVQTQRVKRKKIGPLDTEWFDNAQTGVAPVIDSVSTLLAPLLNQVVGLRTVRV